MRQRGGESSRVAVGRGPTRGTCVGHGLSATPARIAFEAETGVFTWAPGVGFVGAYDLVFVRVTAGHLPFVVRCVSFCSRRGAAQSAPSVVIDTPRSQQDVGQPFVLGRLGRGSRCAARHRHRDAARVGVSARGWATGVSRCDRLRWRRGRMSRWRTAINSRRSGFGLVVKASRPGTTIWPSSLGAPSAPTSCRRDRPRDDTVGSRTTPGHPAFHETKRKASGQSGLAGLWINHRFRSAFCAGVAFALALATAPLAHAQTTALYSTARPATTSAPGRRRAPSRRRTPRLPVSRYRNGVSLRSDGPTLAYWWTLTFVAVDDAPLAVGSYVSARRAPFASPYNGLDVSGSGRGCNELTGRFVVREIA